MRKTIPAVLTLLFVTSAFASELYIIPAFASHGVSNGTLSWSSNMLLTNPHEHGVEIDLGLTVGEIEPHGCRFPEYDVLFPTHLAPRETRRICMPFRTHGAFAFEASEPLIVTSEMHAWRHTGPTTILETRQPIEPGRRWIEAGERALIANVRIGSGARANLIVVNPNEETIAVRYRLIRVASSPPVNHDYEPVEGSVDVAGRSLSITPLPETPLHDCRRLVACGNAIEHELTVESTGRFYAAASSIEHELDATFRGPYLP